jgi:pSer/pThr/pTyr-binding forkhead associated (FHA) protein
VISNQVSARQVSILFKLAGAWHSRKGSIVDEKPVEDRPSADESSTHGKVEADGYDKTKARITTQRVFSAQSAAVDINSILAKVPPDTLGLFIVNSGDLVLVERAERITLGRQTEDAETSISVNLTPHGGEPLGVSRQHAAILVDQDRYVLQDLNSTNGTQLNDVRVPPNIPRVIKNGDMIQLGQLRIYVVFHG